MKVKDVIEKYNDFKIIDVAYYDETDITNVKQLSYQDYYHHANYGVISCNPNEMFKDELDMLVINFEVVSYKKLVEDDFTFQIHSSLLENLVEDDKILFVLAMTF